MVGTIGSEVFVGRAKMVEINRRMFIAKINSSICFSSGYGEIWEEAEGEYGMEVRDSHLELPVFHILDEKTGSKASLHFFFLKYLRKSN